MAIARDILSGLFGATAGGLRGYATRQAEERERMQRQQEMQSQREFELDIMRERQAAGRAAERRAALRSKLDREATERFRTSQLEQQANEAEALSEYRSAERFDQQLADITREFGGITRARAQAMQTPLSETEEVDLIRRLAVQRGVEEGSVAEIVQRLSATSPEVSAPAPAAVERLSDLYRKKYVSETSSPEFTEEELGDELNQLYEAQKVFEDEFGVRKVTPAPIDQAFLGYEAGARARGPLPETVIMGGTPAQRRDYQDLLERINEVTGLLTVGRFRSGT